MQRSIFSERQIKGMKNRDKILIGATTTLAVAGLVMLIVGKTKKTYRRKERLNRIAEEGYEFAADILYPLGNSKRFKSDFDDVKSNAY